MSTPSKIVGQRRRRRNRDIVCDYKKDHPCVVCGEKRSPCLDFHHVDGDKKENVGFLVGKGKPLNKLMSEIEKCIVVCANCHRIIHFGDNPLNL